MKYNVAELPERSIWKRSGLFVGGVSIQTGVEVDEVVEELDDELEEDDAAAQVDFAMVVLFNVTAEILAKNLPVTDEPPLSVIDWSASMSPIKDVPDPRTAELPTCQNTLQA